MKNLENIIKKYKNIDFNSDNYSVGGGLHESGKKASNRHESALADRGKLTFGKSCQMFLKATGKDLESVKEIIKYAIPNMEWHHAGFLPKSYGGGMKKTYFLNSAEIVDLAENWNSYMEKLEISKETKRIAAKKQQTREELQHDFCQKFGKRILREKITPNYFYETECEMNGKYGWFSAYGKSYNLPKYYTGWAFESIEKLNQFYNI